MAQAIKVFTTAAPGFFGLNTQDSPLDLAAGFALVANNCVIDQYGRIGSRKGHLNLNSSTGDLGSNDVGVLHELVQSDGTTTILTAGNGKLFTFDGSALSTLTYDGGGTAPTISANNWHCASLNGITYFFQSTYDPLLFDPARPTKFRRVSEQSGYVATAPQANIVLSAYGRLWAANTSTNKTTVYFSDLTAGHVWTGGTAGSLDVSRVWGNGSDEITGLASHNGFLFIFGKRQILVYQDATSPATMSLADTIIGTGCLSRDSIANIGTDVIFLSNTGVRSLLRTVSEKSLPFRDLSKNVRNDLMTAVASESSGGSAIKAVFSERDAFYLLILPVSKQMYCFDTRGQLEDGSSRVTTWDSIQPTVALARRNSDLLFGKTGYIAKYTGYDDNGSAYRFQYYTNHADLGNQAQTSILKRLSIVVVGGSNQYVTFKWAFDFSSNYLSTDGYIPTQGESYYNVGSYDNSSGQPVTITIASPAVITATDGSYFLTGTVSTDKVRLTTTGALPTGLATGTDYYVINAASPGSTTCNLSSTLGGSAINTSGSQSGTHTLTHTSPTVTTEYSDGVALQTLTVSASGAGKIVQTGYEADIDGSQLSIQKIEIQAKDGKYS